MAAGTAGKTQPWFTIDESLSGTVSTGAQINTRNIAAVCFDTDVELTIGALPVAYTLQAYIPIGIDINTTAISVNADAFMFAMRG